VAVAGTDSIGTLARPGSLVDVLVTSNARTYVALQRIELLDLRSGDGTDSSRGSESPLPGAVATLRVSLRQAVLLVAAQNFARELRLVPRAAGDRGRISAVSISLADLRP
jgi:pilus assembly protein CpaB